MSQTNEEAAHGRSISRLNREALELKEYVEEKFLQVEKQMLAHEEHFIELQNELRTLRDVLLTNTSAMQEYVEVARTAKYFFKTVKFIEAACVWIAKVAAAIGIVLAAWQFAVKQAIASAVSHYRG